MLERARRLATIDPRPDARSRHAGRLLRSRSRRRSDAGAPVPVWRGELYFETHRGTLTSQLRTKLGNRRCERLLVEAELWAATLGRPADVDDLWREVLTQQFHDILPGSSIAWVHADAEAVFDRVGRRTRGAHRRRCSPRSSPADGRRVARQPGRRAGRRRRGARRGRRHRPSDVDWRAAAGRRPARGRWRAVPALGVRGVRVALDRRPGRAVRHVDDQLAPRGAVGPRRQPLLDHRSRAAPASCSRPGSSAPSSSWRRTIRSSTTRGISRRGRGAMPCALTDAHDVDGRDHRRRTARRACRRPADRSGRRRARSPTRLRAGSARAARPRRPRLAPRRASAVDGLPDRRASRHGALRRAVRRRSPARPIRRTRGTPPSSRCARTASSTWPSPTSVSRS